jgi:hypothetical protein
MNLIVLTPYASTNPRSLLRPFFNEEQVCVRSVGTTPCPAHVVTFSLRESQRHLFQISHRGLHPSALRTGGNLDIFDTCVNLNPGIDTLVVTRPDDKTC